MICHSGAGAEVYDTPGSGADSATACRSHSWMQPCGVRRIQEGAEPSAVQFQAREILNERAIWALTEILFLQPGCAAGSISEVLLSGLNDTMLSCLCIWTEYHGCLHIQQ